MRLAVFCGSRTGDDPRYAELTVRTAQAIAARGWGIVYGGGHIGLMGMLADAGLAAGAEVIGVIPQSLAGKEIAHAGLTQLHVVDSMHARKALMERLSDAFLALPGGFGTMDEFCEILTWAQLRIHDKPLGLLNAFRYFDLLLEFFDKMVRDGFVTTENRALIRCAETVDAILETLDVRGVQDPRYHG